MWKYFNLGKIGKPEWVKDNISRRDVAIKYCLKELEFYEDWGRHIRIHWKLWQNIAIISGVLATVLAAIPDKMLGVSEISTAIIKVVPTALTALSATILGVYNYKGEHVRQGLTHDALQGELVKFLSGAEPYNDASEDRNISLFVSNIRTTVSGELTGWRGQFQAQDNAERPAQGAAGAGAS